MKFPKLGPIEAISAIILFVIYSSCSSAIASIWHGVEVWIHGYAQDSVVDSAVCLYMGIRAGNCIIRALGRWASKHQED
jgi:hypothetical protein